MDGGVQWKKQVSGEREIEKIQYDGMKGGEDNTSGWIGEYSRL